MIVDIKLKIKLNLIKIIIPIMQVAFHPDGSLIASGGLDGVGRVWDCRTGRSVLVLSSHVRTILSLDFASDGVKFSTGKKHIVAIYSESYD